jgi:hypothetical protein
MLAIPLRNIGINLYGLKIRTKSTTTFAYCSSCYLIMMPCVMFYLVSMPKSFSISGFLTASIPASVTASGNLSGEAVARTT